MALPLKPAACCGEIPLSQMPQRMRVLHAPRVHLLREAIHYFAQPLVPFVFKPKVLCFNRQCPPLGLLKHPFTALLKQTAHLRLCRLQGLELLELSLVITQVCTPGINVLATWVVAGCLCLASAAPGRHAGSATESMQDTCAMLQQCMPVPHSGCPWQACRQCN